MWDKVKEFSGWFGEYALRRMSEPSTWVSLGSVFTAAGVAIAPEHWQLITTIGLGVGGALGAALTERRRFTKAEVREVVEETVKSTAIKGTG